GVQSLFVDSGDVYMAVSDNNGPNPVAKYWKNDTPVVLTDGSTPAQAFSIFMDRGDVYVAGYEDEGLGATAKYWKNGTSVILEGPHPASLASSIVVTRSLGDD